jgi:hypothetical protein
MNWEVIGELGRIDWILIIAFACFVGVLVGGLCLLAWTHASLIELRHQGVLLERLLKRAEQARRASK